MMRKTFLAAALVSAFGAASAAELGALTVYSNVGEPLEAKLEVRDVNPKVEPLLVRLAPASVYQRVGKDSKVSTRDLTLELEKEKRRGSPIPKKVNIGLMIEVPSVIFQLEAILKQADFISVGTNDLAQFVFACDRGNPRLSERYDVLSAPFLKLMHEIVSQANKAKVLCSVCGEMASNPIEALALIGLGYRNLSMSGSAFGKVKSMVRSTNLEDIEDYIKIMLKSNRRTLRPQLISYANDHGIEIY